MSDELDRNAPASDEGEKDEDVEAHRQHGGAMQDEGQEEGKDEGDDVEAHRQHGGVGRQHGGA